MPDRVLVFRPEAPAPTLVPGADLMTIPSAY